MEQRSIHSVEMSDRAKLGDGVREEGTLSKGTGVTNACILCSELQKGCKSITVDQTEQNVPTRNAHTTLQVDAIC